jgi:exosortase family protein XrtM
MSNDNQMVRSRPWIFLLMFPAVYGVLHFMYFALPEDVLRHGVHYYGIVLPAVALLNVFAPGEGVYAQIGSLHSARASLEIVRGCDGAGVVFLLVSAILASSAGMKRKLLGILAGTVLIYLLNELRVIALYFVIAYRNPWFGPLHNYFVPMLLIAATLLFFLAWTSWVRDSENARAPGSALPMVR